MCTLVGLSGQSACSAPHDYGDAGQPWLYSEFQASLSYVTLPYLGAPASEWVEATD